MLADTGLRGWTRLGLGALLLTTTWQVACFGDKPAPEKPPPIVKKKKPPTTAQVDVSVYESADAKPVEPRAEDLEQEPNDGPEEALPLTSGQPAKGVIEPPKDKRKRKGDQDWYVLTVPGTAPMLARAALTGADDIDVVLEYAHPKKRRGGKYRAIVQADVQVKKPGDEVLPALKLDPGKHYFRVREAWYRAKKRTGSAKPYTLTVSLRSWQEGVDAEPNDRDPKALSVAFDASGDGLIGHMGDRDPWRVEVPTDKAGGRVRATITPIPGVKMTAAVRVGEKGNYGKTAIAEEGHGLVLRNITVPLPAAVDGGEAKGSTPVFVRVGARDGASVESGYTVRVSPEVAIPEGGKVENEPNDDLGTGTLVELPAGGAGQVLYYGFLDHRRDVDIYRIEVKAPMSLGALLTPPLEADYAFDLRGPGDTALSAKRAKAGQNEVMRGVGLTPGTWRLLVRRQRGKANAKAMYALTLDFADGTLSESEPNNTVVGRLKPLQPGKALKGWIYPAGDRDFWTVDLSKATEGRIATFKVKAPPGLVLEAGLYKDDGSVITLKKRLAAEATFTHYLQPGVYRVQMWAQDKNGAEAQTPYELTLLE